MSTNGINNAEDTDMAECDGEKVVTMMDVLQEEQDFEDDANAVLGASDEKNCTYAKGYIKRQAIYACLTCCFEAKFDPTKRAGVCLACSLNCHESHELVELYTKRNFRCDCGNPKFNSHPCQFTPSKPDFNEDNSYNQNFSGLYCTCQRPYPDPDSPVENDEMIQCVICEDWLHSSHLETTVPGADQYDEMVCKACMEKNDFLYDYSQFAVNDETQDVVDIIGINGTDTLLTNGNMNKTLLNCTGDLTETTDKLDETTNVIEKAENNMDIDDAQNEKTSPDCSEVTSQSGSNVDKEPSDVTMETDAGNDKNTSQNSLETVTESTDNSTNQVVPEKDLEETTKSESLIEPSTTEMEEKSEESTKVDDANATETLEEPKDILQENVDMPEDIQDSAATEKMEEKPKQDNPKQPNPEDSFKDPEKQNNPEQPNPEDIVKDSEKEDAVKMEESKLEVVAPSAESKAEATNFDSNEIINKQEDNISTTNENNSTETTCADKPTVSEQTEEITVTKEEESVPENVIDINKDKIDESSETTEESMVENKTEEIKDHKRKLSTEESAETDDQIAKKPKITEKTNCIRPRGVKKVHKGATFWPSDFRQKLCTCSECLAMYKDLSVLFLLDLEDTVSAYTALGKERVNGRATQYEKGLEALSSLDRIQQINALTEYNKMKDKLLDFLKSFKDRKEVVKEEDIKAFFAGMKPKREPDGVYFCR